MFFNKVNCEDKPTKKREHDVDSEKETRYETHSNILNVGKL